MQSLTSINNTNEEQSHSLNSNIINEIKKNNNNHSMEDVNNDEALIPPSNNTFEPAKKSLISNVISELENSSYDQKTMNLTKEKIWRVVRQIKKNKKEFTDKLKKDKWYVINPQTSIFRMIFDIMIMILLAFDFVLSPYECFVVRKKLGDRQTDQTYGPYIREYIFDSIFVIELILNFFTGYYDFSLGFVITDMKKIAIHFIKYGFVIDLICILPLYLFDSTFLLIRLIKLYRYPGVLSTIKKYLNSLISFLISNLKLKQQIIQVIIFFFSLVYILHLCSCIYVFIGDIYYSIQEGKPNWINTVFKDETKEVENYRKYISSMYQITQTFTTTGYGDLHPINNIEIIFIMFCEIVNCGLFAYLLTCILEILTNKENTLRFKYQNAKIDMQQWATAYMANLPQSSKEKNLHRDDIWVDVKRFFEIYYLTEKNFSWINQFKFMKQLKPKDRKELLDNAFFNFRLKFRKLFDLVKNENTKNTIVLNLHTQIEKKEYKIIELEKEIKKIYLIEQGSVSVCKGGNELTVLNEGDIFGIEGLIDPKSKFLYKVSSNSDFAIFYTIKISVLINDIINYDVDTYKEFLNYTTQYLKEINKEQKDVIHIVEDNNDIINTNLIQIANNEYDNKGVVGSLPDRMKRIERIKKSIEGCDECEKRLDLISKQLIFIEKYIKEAI